MPGQEVPAELIDAIVHGRCVAFVGAGFSIPTVPPWNDLLRALVKAVPAPAPLKADLSEWLGGSSLTSREYEAIAQAIESLQDRSAFARTLRSVLRPDGVSRELHADQKNRTAWLLGTPLRAILTTNFDEVLEGDAVPSPEAYGRILAAPPRAWTAAEFWSGGALQPPPTIKLHGTVARMDEDIVFSTLSYRTLLHEKAGYKSFLRAVFATHTVLFLGFSFTDEYINELRSEILSMIGLEAKNRGRDFAVVDTRKMPRLMRRHMEEHEGLHLLSYESNDEDQHSGFDRWLEAIHDATNPHQTLRNVIRGRRILWFDPSASNNDYGYAVLRDSGGSGSTVIDSVLTVDDALAKLAEHDYDLVISHFGWRPAGPSNAEALLSGMRSGDLRAPVIVFASGHERESNRNCVLRLGALAYADRHLVRALRHHGAPLRRRRPRPTRQTDRVEDPR